MATATVSVVLRRDDGVTVSREVIVTQSPYGRLGHESQTSFKNRARRQANAALTAVFGAPAGLKVEEGK